MSKPDAKQEQDRFFSLDRLPSRAEVVCYFSKFAIPACITMFVGSAQPLISNVFAGHLGDESKLAAFGIGHSTMALLVYPFMMGINAA
jgi:Na+-driven multidrug efflux pump